MFIYLDYDIKQFAGIRRMRKADDRTLWKHMERSSSSSGLIMADDDDDSFNDIYLMIYIINIYLYSIFVTLSQ